MFFDELAFLVGASDFAFGCKSQRRSAVRTHFASRLVPHHEIAGGIFVAAIKHFAFFGFAFNDITFATFWTSDSSFLLDVHDVLALGIA